MTIAKQNKNEAEWVTKDGLIQRFEGLNKNTLNVWLMEMRKHEKYHDQVINPTHKLVWINVAGFTDFLKWKAHERGF